MPESTSNTQMRPEPGHGEMIRVFLRIGLISFGGPAGQIALMHRILVEEKRWISGERFLHALGYCMLLPGPEAQQLATYTGWLLRGWRGGVIAGVLFVLPGLITMIALSALYAVFGQTDWLSGVFFGLKAAILVIIFQALARLCSKALGTAGARIIAIAAFLALYVFSVPFPLVVIVAGLIGFLAARGRHVSVPVEDAPVKSPPGSARLALLRKAALHLPLWLLIWQAPAALLLVTGAPEILSSLNTLFSWLALVTFGGAYAALAWVAQVASQTHGWLLPGEMLDGLALAETTPGPLVLVLSYVGFLAAFRNPGGLEPLLAGTLGATVAAWATFVPGFMFIFAGAPFIEKLRDNRTISSALSAVTAAVVGVMFNLALWFAMHTLFPEVGRIVLWQGWREETAVIGLTLPSFASLDPAALAITVFAAVLVFFLRQPVGRVLVLCAATGWLWRFLM